MNANSLHSGACCLYHPFELRHVILISSESPPSRISPTHELPRLRAPRIAVLVLIVFGFSCTEAISNNVLALTLHRHTTSAFVIGAILALNPFFGILGQPFAAYWSDRIWTPLGRRAVFLLIASPIVAICLITIPFMRELWHLALIIIVYQFFQDIIYGAYFPLIADMMPSSQRAWVMGFVTVATWLAGIVVVRFGLAWVESHTLATGGANFGLPLYASCAVVQVVLVAGGALLLREPRPQAAAPAVRFSLRSYFSVLRADASLRRLAIVNACHGIYYGSAMDFAVLFGTVTLGMSMSTYGGYAGWAPLVAMAVALPAAWLNTVMPRNRLLGTLIAGQLVVCGICLFTRNAFLFGAMLWLNVLCISGFQITFRSFSTEFCPPGQTGQALGAIQVFFGLGRMAGLLFVGRIIALAGNDYRLAWAIGGICSLVAMIVAWRLVEPRRKLATF